MSNETVSLLPCKKCGADEGQAYANGGMYGVECQNCGYVVGPKAFEQDARECWNNRPVLSKPVAGVEVKPLEWQGDEAQTPFGKYRVYRTDDGYGVSFEHDELVHVGFNSVRTFESPRDTAISYAQPDYQNRILSTLSLPAQEPVASMVAEIDVLLDNCHVVEDIDIAAQHEAVKALVRKLASPQPEAVITEEMVEKRHRRVSMAAVGALRKAMVERALGLSESQAILIDEVVSPLVREAVSAALKES